MSVFTNNVYAKELTDVIGIGVTLADGVVTAVTGPTWRRSTVDPNGVVTANAGSLISRTNGTLYVNTNGGTTWVAIGGTSGGNYPNDVPCVFGTTSPLQGTIVYVSASNLWSFTTGAVSQATAQASASTIHQTGSVTITGAVVGTGSGTAGFGSGSTDCTNAGGTGGASGNVDIFTGSALSTAGVSGASGRVRLLTGNSDDGNSGDIRLETGTAGGTRGSLDIRTPFVSVATQATDLRVNNASGTAFRITTLAGTLLQAFATTPANAITFGDRMLSNLPAAVGAAADGTGAVPIMVAKTYAAGISTTDFALPQRTGGSWRVINAWIRSDGATGGSVQLQTAGGAANVTDAMVPGNANVITRCASITNANATFASGATARLNITAGAPAGEAFLMLQPL